MTKIIAEFCQNHNGDRAILRDMIGAAKENGATYGKIQSIWADRLTRRPEFETGEKDAAGAIKTIQRPYEPEYARLKKLELSVSDHAWFIDECKKAGLIPFTTIFAQGDIEPVAALSWPGRLVKVASYDCASLPYLQKLAENFDTLLISTGATYDEEIEKAAAMLKTTNKVFIHCVTKYPNELEDCHLARLEYLRRFSKEVGWSDHTHVAKDGIKAAQAAIYLGADYVERHFTILPADKTKDGPVSITPAHLKKLSAFAQLPKADQKKVIDQEIPEFQKMIGQSRRNLSPSELLNRHYYRGRFATHVDGKPVYNWEPLKK